MNTAAADAGARSVLVKFDEETFALLRDVARVERVTLADVIRQALAAYLRSVSTHA